MPSFGRTASGGADARATTAGAAAYVLTAPGRTAAVSVVIDPLVEELAVGRAASAVGPVLLVGEPRPAAVPTGAAGSGHRVRPAASDQRELR
ncbi:hypothetical protein [Pseudonocardia nigra]|uniref:hypothetical protein n=1 Tax=Pseudonocardia nigra TaxID=1921578 RepID=UPI001C5D8981|nr:hypothetical protein [Pseudonocardia nigra]